MFSKFGMSWTTGVGFNKTRACDMTSTAVPSDKHVIPQARTSSIFACGPRNPVDSALDLCGDEAGARLSVLASVRFSTCAGYPLSVLSKFGMSWTTGVGFNKTRACDMTSTAVPSDKHVIPQARTSSIFACGPRNPEDSALELCGDEAGARPSVFASVRFSSCASYPLSVRSEFGMS